MNSQDFCFALHSSLMSLDFLTGLYIPWTGYSSLISWGLASGLTTSIGGQFNVDFTRGHSFLHFWNILEARTFTTFLWLGPEANLLTMLSLRLDFHKSSKQHFLCYSHFACLPSKAQKSNVINALVRVSTCLLQVALLLNKEHALSSHPKWLGSLSKNLSDSNENHLVSGEIGGVNHLFAGVHFPRKTQKQKFTSAMESDVPSIIFPY